MPNHAKVRSHVNTLIPNGPITYVDVQANGQIHILAGENKYLVTGLLYERTQIQGAGEALKWSRKLVKITPGYKPSVKTDQSAVANCAKTGKSYRVVGQFRAVLMSDKSKPLVMTGNLVNMSVRTEANMGTSVPHGWADAIERKQRELTKYRRELDRIVAQRNSGLDPQIRMSFITFFVAESRASLYRKLGTTFPLPVKRGKSSFWSMSSIEAYMAGGNHE